jgi:hypothetical protein
MPSLSHGPRHPFSQDEAFREFKSTLMHAIEQADKNQWWNSISVLLRAQEIAVRRFDEVLKREN